MISKLFSKKSDRLLTANDSKVRGHQTIHLHFQTDVFTAFSNRRYGAVKNEPSGACSALFLDNFEDGFRTSY
jgi:hypothetical protein